MRLFAAINFPPAEKTRLATLLDQLRTFDAPVRWLDHETLHVTLKFLGDVPDTQVPQIVTALEAAVQNIPSFDVVISGFGAFPSSSRPRVFWLGFEQGNPVSVLQKAVDDELQKVGFSAEDRAYTPHVTIGKARENGRPGREVVDRMNTELEYKAVLHVDSADLMRSHLGPKGARYELLHAAKLRNH